MSKLNFVKMHHGQRGPQSGRFVGVTISSGTRAIITKQMYDDMGEPEFVEVMIEPEMEYIGLNIKETQTTNAYKVVVRPQSSPFVTCKLLKDSLPDGHYHFIGQDGDVYVFSQNKDERL